MQTLKKYPDEKVVVGGHTDSTGDPEWNRRLSRKRAESVRRYLVVAGISPNRLLVEGHGAVEPIATNRTASGRSRNRRVEIKAALEATNRARLFDTGRAGGPRQVVVNDQTVTTAADGSFRTTVDPNRDQGRVYVGIRRWRYSAAVPARRALARTDWHRRSSIR